MGSEKHDPIGITSQKTRDYIVYVAGLSRHLLPACFHPTLTGLRRDLFIVNFIKLPKQVSVSTSALKNDVVSVQFVNE